MSGPDNQLGGLHHVTAITGRAKANLDFYTQTIGLRLVKKTVNQDVTSSYHLFYADERGSPGTDMTFFDWPKVPANSAGRGEVSSTGFIVPETSLDWWWQRFDDLSVDHGPIEKRGERSSITFTDAEGQRLELIAPGRSEAVPWSQSPVPVEHAVRGLASVTLTVGSLGPTSTVLEGVLGFRPAEDVDAVSGQRVFETGPGGLGAEVRVVARPDLPAAESGVGGVHHVAFRTRDEASLREWRAKIAGAHLSVTDVIDRYYFKSIYFREAGGVLFEIATDGPGFAQDEDMTRLGEALSLPPFLEPRRAEIEAQLQPL